MRRKVSGENSPAGAFYILKNVRSLGWKAMSGNNNYLTLFYTYKGWNSLTSAISQRGMESRIRREYDDALPDCPRSYGARRRRTFSEQTPSVLALARTSMTAGPERLSAHWASLAASSCRLINSCRLSRSRAQTHGASLSPEIFRRWFTFWHSRQKLVKSWWKLWKLSPKNSENFPHGSSDCDNCQNILIIHDCLSAASLESDLNKFSHFTLTLSLSRILKKLPRSTFTN